MWSPTPEYLAEVIDACEGAQIQKDLIKKDLLPVLEKFGGLDLHRFPPSFRWNLCSARMILGDFSNYDGWEFRSNWSITYQGHNGKSFNIPKWDGRPVDHLVIMGEQGIGDEILYGSLIPELMIRLGPDALEFQCHPRLQEIFTRSYGIRCTDRRNLSEVTEGDATVALSDLMMWYRRDKSQFPKKPFFKLDPEMVKTYGKELNKVKGEKIGITWATRKGIIDPDELVYEIKKNHPDATLINLQYHKEGFPECPKGVLDIQPDPMEKLEEHICFIANLNRLITTTQTVVHESGAIGIPTEVIKPPRGTGEVDSQLWYYNKNAASNVYCNSINYDSLEDYSRLTKRG